MSGFWWDMSSLKHLEHKTLMQCDVDADMNGDMDNRVDLYFLQAS